MADYFEAHGFNVLSNCTDADPTDTLSVVQGSEDGISFSAPTYPQTYNLDIGQFILESASGDGFVRLMTDTNNPDPGNVAAAGTLYFTFQDNHGAPGDRAAEVTFNLQGDSGGAAPDYVATGLVERWAADAGVTLSGSDVTDWLGQVQGLNLDAVGTPTVGTPLGGTAGATIVIGPDEGMTGATLTGLPVGAASRTVQMIWKPTGGFGYAGFGWGTNTTDGAFTLSVDGSDEIALDTFNNRVNVPIHPADQWLTMTVTYDGTTSEIWLGDVLVASAARDLATGSSLINLCRTFSGRTTEAEIGEILVYGRVLSASEIQANVAYLNGRFIGSSAMGAPDEAVGSAIAETSFRASAPANIPFCVAAWSARASSTPASESEILAGTGAVDFGIAFVDGDGNIVADITGAAASTDYYVNWITYGLTGGKSAVVTSAAITTAATPVTNPVLSAPSMTPTGQTTATAKASTTVGNGTLNYGLMLQGATTPNATQLKAGTDGDDAPLIGGLRTKAITATGVQNVSFTALTSDTAYKVVFYQEDGSGNPSNIVTATATTDAVTAPTTSLSPDVTYSTWVAAEATLDAWEADPTGTAPAGKTWDERRVLMVDQPHTGSVTLSHDFSAIPGGVVIRGTGPYGEHPTYPFYPTCGSHISGTLNVANSANLQVRLITCAQLVMRDAPGVVAAYDVSVNARLPARQTPTVQIGVNLINAPGVIVEGCHVAGFRTCSISIGANCHDAAVDENYMEQFSDDLLKCRHGSGVLNRPARRRNWGGRDNLSPTGAHADYAQDQDGTINNPVFEGNVVIEGSALYGIGFQGGMFQSTLNQSPGAIVRQNIFCMRGANGITALGGGGTNDCSDNTLLYSEWGDHGSVQPSGYAVPTIVGGWGTKERNAVCRLNSGSADTSGTDGDVFTIGNVFNSTVVADTSRYPLYWEGFPGENRYIGEIKPKVGTRAHWNYPGTTRFAAERSKEIFQDGLHPGNRGWPTAAAWHREYDPANTTGSSWTGSYDADGKNASASPTSVTINDPALTVYDSDPYGVDAARITFTGTHNQDGSTLQIRVYDPSDDSDVVGWTDFTAGASGAWSKVIDVPRGWNACRAEVRAKFSTGVNDQQGADFYSGYIVGLLGQSLAERPMYISPSGAALTPPAKTLWLISNDQNGSSAAGQIEVMSGSILGLRRAAALVAARSDAPLCIVDLAASGTAFGSLTNASESTTMPERSWFLSFQNPVDYVQSRGSDLSIVLWHWFTNEAAVQWNAERFLMPGLTKQALNGIAATGDGSGLTAYTSGSIQVVPIRAYTPVHFLWDMNGTGQGSFDEGRTRLCVAFGASFYRPSDTSGVWSSDDIQKGKYGQAQRDMCDGTGVGQISLANVPGYAGHTAFGGHIAMPGATHVGSATGEHDGEALVMTCLVTAMLRAVGALNQIEPRIIGVTDAGTHWDVEIDLPHGGDLSTPLIEFSSGSYAGSFEDANWIIPTAIDEGDIAALHEVQGFAVWTGGSASWTGFTAVIQDTGTGTAPSRTGIVRVTPTGGTSGKALSFGYAGWPNLTLQADVNAARPHLHKLIETWGAHTSGAGYGWPVRMQPGNTSIVAES